MGSFKCLFGLPTLFICVVLVPITFCSETIPDAPALNFDRLFPQTALQMVLETCLRINYDLHIQTMRGAASQDDVEELIDVVVGRLYRVRASVQEIAASNVVLHEEDILYLLSLLETITQNYQGVMLSGVPAHGKHALALLSDIKVMLDEVAR